MISSRYNFIYLHVPKTGGNSIQTVLLPFSDDQMILVAHQDGKDRFDVRGSVTPHKHATLADYAVRLGDQVDNFRIAISVRHPFYRAYSMYCSPNRWMQKTADGSWQKIPPQWDPVAFLEVASKMLPASAFLTINGELKRPTYVLRNENLVEDFNRMAGDLGLPVGGDSLPHVNRSAAVDDQREKLFADKSLLRSIERLFAADMAAFGYSPISG